ncbi:hypothetical protein [Kribbella sp. NPDC051770]|uniref:hypothetical protein n=1 Tax=Kribbella sp. NPDC051770 TaxID=3155413 RepID=UPI00343B2147
MDRLTISKLSLGEEEGVSMSEDSRPSSESKSVTGKYVRHALETHLRREGLSLAQISRQTSDELEVSLNKINRLLDGSKAQFDLLMRDEDMASILPAWNDVDRHEVQRVFRSGLLHRKSLILKRLQELRPAEQIRDIREAIAARVSDTAVRESLLQVVDDAESDQKKEQERLASEEREVQQEERRQKLQMDMFERRTAVYHTFLERESIASIVGAVLLLLLAISLIVSMFVGTAATEVVSNSFLLVLGYFFGQGVARRERDKDGSN